MDEAGDRYHESTVNKLEDLRLALRRKECELKIFEPDDSTSKQDMFDESLAMVKDYIKTTRHAQSKASLLEEKLKTQEVQKKQSATTFIISQIIRGIEDLEEENQKQPTEGSEDDLVKWQTSFRDSTALSEKIGENLSKLLQSPTFDPIRFPDITTVQNRYEKLCTSKRTFAKLLDDEITFREIDKNIRFNKSSLNINIEKFTGYDSKIDFFTFGSEFEKMYLQSTPKRLLPDLLICTVTV